MGQAVTNIGEVQGLLTADDVAELLGIPRKTVYDHIAKGKIPCVRLYSGMPRVEPLVALALREGATSEVAHQVAAALATGAAEAEVVVLWRRPRGGEVVSLPVRGGKDG